MKKSIFYISMFSLIFGFIATMVVVKEVLIHVHF